MDGLSELRTTSWTLTQVGFEGCRPSAPGGSHEGVGQKKIAAANLQPRHGRHHCQSQRVAARRPCCSPTAAFLRQQDLSRAVDRSTAAQLASAFSEPGHEAFRAPTSSRTWSRCFGCRPLVPVLMLLDLLPCPSLLYVVAFLLLRQLGTVSTEAQRNPCLQWPLMFCLFFRLTVPHES